MNVERNQEATVYVGNLDERMNEALVWELFLQAGPVGMCPISHPVNVFLPKDRLTMTHQGFGFVEFMSEEDADYAIRVFVFSSFQDYEHGQDLWKTHQSQQGCFG